MHGKALGCWGIRAKTYILDMVEAKRGSPASVLQGLSGEGLIVAVDKAADQEEELGARTCSKDLWPHWALHEPAWPPAQPMWAARPSGEHPTSQYPRAWTTGSLELAEDVGIFSRDAGCLQDCHTEGEGAA